jgi:hypothetical protein
LEAAPVAAAEWVALDGVRILRMEYVEVVSYERCRRSILFGIHGSPWSMMLKSAGRETALWCDAGQFGTDNEDLFPRLSGKHRSR